VTGDKALLAVRRFRGIPVLNLHPYLDTP